ncbi:MAG: hypothetical protein KJ630_05580 [Proteobacteria bacterium]|nr:hypothetical protein [Pseudomonadota bacterium]
MVEGEWEGVEDMKKKIIFEQLVENAIDFLSKAIDELKDHPKFSMINFHASLEIFIKARLMAEHWTLVVAKRQEPDWEKFLAGDFQSVSLDDAAFRLDKVVKSGLSKNEVEIFREVARHRNKMVHFFHEVHTEENNIKLRQEIARTQLIAWYFLHKLLTEKWKETFEPWSEKIIEIDCSLRKLHEFLKIIFENHKNKIEEYKKQGFIFANCPSCGFKSHKHQNVKKTIYDSECMVCGLNGESLQIECSGCDATVFFMDEGFSICLECGKKYEPEDLAEVLIDSGGAHIAAMDGDDTSYSANCSECDGYQTVVRTENDEHICASCFGIFDSLQVCQWCNEYNTGDMEYSYTFGCNFCEGSSGSHDDD